MQRKSDSLCNRRRYSWFFITFRLLRVALLVRVMRTIPEIVVVIRGISTALRAIFVVLLLVGFLTYITAIVLRLVLEDAAFGAKHCNSIPSCMARSPVFEGVSLFVVTVNSFWISVDLDLNEADNLSDADAIFQIAAHLFCLFFCGELLVRFLAFKHKTDSAKDFWFIFDLAIVFDTWVMLVFFAIATSGGNAGGPRIFVVFQNISAPSSRTFGSRDENHSRNNGHNPRDKYCASCYLCCVVVCWCLNRYYRKCF